MSLYWSCRSCTSKGSSRPCCTRPGFTSSWNREVGNIFPRQLRLKPSSLPCHRGTPKIVVCPKSMRWGWQARGQRGERLFFLYFLFPSILFKRLTVCELAAMTAAWYRLLKKIKMVPEYFHFLFVFVMCVCVWMFRVCLRLSLCQCIYVIPGNSMINWYCLYYRF